MENIGNQASFLPNCGRFAAAKLNINLSDIREMRRNHR